MRNSGTTDRRRLAAFGLAAAVALVPAAAASAAAPSSTATSSGSDRAAAVQGVLDRVVGPGNAVVTVSDTIQTSTASTTSVRWGSGATGASAVSTTTVAGTTTSSSIARQNLVGGTSTATVTPPGSLVRQSVSVAVDRAHIGARSIASLRRLVASAAGITPSRGDALSVVVLPFAKHGSPTAAPVSPSVGSMLMPYAVPATWGVGGVAALVILVLAVGRRSRRSTGLVRQ